MDGREQRGLEIATTMNLRRNGDMWVVPSQTRSGAKYTVNLRGELPKCSCPDYDLRQQKCKHIFAVEFSVRRETTPEGTTTVTKTVRVTYGQDWASYNAAQQAICGTAKRRDISPPRRITTPCLISLRTPH